MWVEPAAGLRGDADPGVVPAELAQESFASAVAVHVGRVEEGDAELDGAVERRQRRGVVDGAPTAADVPGA